MWDCLPLNTGGEGSILRLDHIMPIGRHSDWYRFTEYRLDDEAVATLRQWLEWLLEGEIAEDSNLGQIREVLQGYD